ncbi:MAG: RAD55 family ATPase [Candidatus Odinarchaeota archaeon]
MELRSTGISGLNELLRGGVPADSLTLLLGDAGTGKSLLARQFLWEGIHKEENSISILTETHREAMTRSLQDFGWDITAYTGKNLRIIEGFTLSYPDFLSKLEDSDREFTLEALNLDKLIHLLTTAAIQLGEKGRCIFDSLSDLFILLGNDRKVLRFLRRVKVFLAGEDYSTIMTLDPHTQGTIATNAAMHIADGIIEIRLREGPENIGLQREIRVRAMPQGHDSTWHPLEITPKGLIVEAK